MGGQAEESAFALAKRVLSGERRALARAITLVESTRAGDEHLADTLLGELLPYAGKSIRLGVSGAPGVGKSTFIETFGQHLTSEGHKVAVLAVDPSSSLSGGSILGDKTRMEALSRDPNAFIRPSPSRGALGGVTSRTREAILLVEAAGYDLVLVETVGVGQSEVDVDNMVDMFLLILSPGGGDELQGIKRGIMELADLIIVNKADGDLLKPATIAAAEYQAAVQFMRPRHSNWTCQVVLASALEGTGLDDVRQQIEAYRDSLSRSGEFEERRRQQEQKGMWKDVEEGLLTSLHERPEIKELAESLEAGVARRELTVGTAARRLVNAFLGKDQGS